MTECTFEIGCKAFKTSNSVIVFKEKNVDIKFSAHDAFLEKPSPGTHDSFMNKVLYLQAYLVLLHFRESQ